MTADNAQVESLVGALVDANDQLLALYDLASITADSLDESEVVGRILSRAQGLLRADALLLATEPEHATGNAVDVAKLRLGQADRSEQGLSTSAVATVSSPDGNPVAVSALRHDNPFGTADTKLLEAVAKMLAGAVHTARLHETAVAQAVINRDHDTASKLAQSALPKWLPELDGVDLFARSEPARSAGGDLYTFAVVDGILHFSVGDVSGKGLPAAMMMTNVISASNAAFQRHGPEGPVAILEAIDRWVYQSLSDAGLFVTILVGSYNPASNELAVVNAGHSPVVFKDATGITTLGACAPPVGVLPLDNLEALSRIVAPGDRLVVASDGLTEQQSPAGEMFGDDRLDKLIETDTCSNAAEFGALLFDRIEMFADVAPQSDDRTLFILEFGETP